MRTTLPFASLVVLAIVCTLSACTPKVESYFDKAALPEQVVPLYDEVATFKAKATDQVAKPRDKKKLRLDLNFLMRESKVEQAIIVPFDAEYWLEPITVKLDKGRAVVDLDISRDFLVALDLGEQARNNYQAITQLGAARGLFPDALKPKLCQLVLCSAERFPLAELPQRIPEVEGLPFEIANALPPLDVGPIGGNRAGSICDKCFDQVPNILPCIIWRWCGDLPLKRIVHVRKNIYTLTPAEITSLRAGVAAMKAKPATDPTSWLYQARMHAIDSGTAAALQDQCQHRQFFFFAWHRMFVYYNERIMRKASGNPNFAQPYWNYTDNAAQAPIPEPYRLPADTSTNSLYNGTRAAVYNGGAGIPASDVSYTAGFNLSNFTTPSGSQSFGGATVATAMHFPSPSPGTGRIEQSPHNNLHNDIGGAGGDMAGGESPRDPVFWLHHSNIDRLWKRWLALGNGRVNPTGDAIWMTHVFTFFDENGTQVNLTGAQILNTVDQLGYRYDDDPLVLWPLAKEKLLMAQLPRPGDPEPIASVKRQVKLTATRVDTRVRIEERNRAALTASLQGDVSKDRLIVRLSDIRYDAPVGITYLLFLNLPAQATNLNLNHPNFIGTLGFFGAGHGEHRENAPGLTEEYDVSRVVRRLGLTGDLVITAVPSLPTVPEGRDDLKKMVDQMKPNGNPRFGEVSLVRVRSQ